MRNQIQPALYLACLATVFASMCASQQPSQTPSLRIVSPPNGTVVKPGDTIHVTVAAVGDFTGVMVVGADPLSDSKGRTRPPWKFSIKVPKKDIDSGLSFITASGGLANGQSVDSDPIDIDVERPDPPLDIWTEPSFLNVEIGRQNRFDVLGTYADDPSVDLTESTQTTLVSEDPNIAKVTPQHNILGVSAGKTRIIVDGRISVEVIVRAHDWWKRGKNDK
jgi:hypothetical protein